MGCIYSIIFYIFDDFFYASMYNIHFVYVYVNVDDDVYDVNDVYVHVWFRIERDRYPSFYGQGTPVLYIHV